MADSLAPGRPLPPAFDRTEIPKEIREKIREAAEGMESIFIEQMMKAMRKTVPKGEMSLERFDKKPEAHFFRTHA